MLTKVVTVPSGPRDGRPGGSRIQMSTTSSNSRETAEPATPTIGTGWSKLGTSRPSASRGAIGLRANASVTTAARVFSEPRRRSSPDPEQVEEVRGDAPALRGNGRAVGDADVDLVAEIVGEAM